MKKLKKRHWLLPALCILTCIGSGFGLFISILSLINLDLIRFIINIPTFTSVATNIADSHFSYSIVRGILYVLSITGALYMWKLKKKGFFIYTASQLLLPLISFFYFPYPLMQTATIVIPDYIFAVAFIALYSLHLSSMRSNKKNTENDLQPDESGKE